MDPKVVALLAAHDQILARIDEMLKGLPKEIVMAAAEYASEMMGAKAGLVF